MTVPKYSLAATANVWPDRPAVIDAESGEVVTFAELEDRSHRIAQLLAATGLRRGDHIAILMENNKRYLEVVWAAQRSGLYLTPVNWHLTAAEAHYVIEDCGAAALFVSSAVGDLARGIRATPSLRRRFCIDGPVDGHEDLDLALAELGAPAEPPPSYEPVEGALMFYSSGTTGRPKGIVRPLPDLPFGESSMQSDFMREAYGQDGVVQLCSAPIYHAAPLPASMMAQRVGGTVVMMQRFDAEAILRLIERHRVTHAQFAPTVFVRLLKLREEVRNRYDVSSLRTVIHTAAACPVAVKEQMIAWWGEKIWEIYAGSEGNGVCLVDSGTWLQHKGTVGKAISGVVHIVDEDGGELPPGMVGTIYFSDAPAFEYHNDPAKTASSRLADGWSTLGDLGYVDEDGFLYISDRRTDLIISGGVNIYPREVEEVLLAHPRVLDVAVIGVPDPDMGHQVKAVVQPVDPADVEAGVAAGFAAELIDYCRSRIAHFKCPRSVDFDLELPRLPNGKLLKRVVLERYRPALADASLEEASR